MSALRLSLLLTALLLAGLAPRVKAQQVPDLPRPSPKAQVMQRMGVADITLTYSSPGVKGRDIWGGLVPYDEIWRTGANEATHLKLSKPLRIEGEKIPAGDYALFTIPGKKEWTLILNSDWDQWGTGNYDPEKNVLEATIEPEKTRRMQERMIFFFDLKSNEEGKLVLHWNELMLPIELEAPVVEQSMANIEESLEGYDDRWKALSEAAEFCLDYDTHQEQALAWAKESVALHKDFSNYWILTKLTAREGNYEEALEMAEECMSLLEDKSEGYRSFYGTQVRKSMERWKEAS
jgi:tetratricopeptide (TPR) repeat protein